ncbi:MAG: WD40 repeat domain-containing protein [Planctomycetes bacterium]|nr:WD40 repeat domain-containing protein [Planctomycetota bacterium]
MTSLSADRLYAPDWLYRPVGDSSEGIPATWIGLWKLVATKKIAAEDFEYRHCTAAEWQLLSSSPRDGKPCAASKAAVPASAPSEQAEAALKRGVERCQAGDLSAAKAAYREAAELGHPDALFYLGDQLEEEGDLGAAEHAFERGDAQGDLRCSNRLSRLLEQVGRTDEAVRVIERGSGWGDARSASRHAHLLQKSGDLAGAIAAFGRAESLGDENAALDLGLLLVETSDGRAQAEDAWRRSSIAGNASGALNLGILLHQRGDQKGAVKELLRAHQIATTRDLKERAWVVLVKVHPDPEALLELATRASAAASSSAFGEASPDTSRPATARTSRSHQSDTLECPHCHKVLRLRHGHEARGKRARCSGCQGAFTIPYANNPVPSRDSNGDVMAQENSQSRRGRADRSPASAVHGRRKAPSVRESDEMGLAGRLRAPFANPWILSGVVLVFSAALVGTFIWLGSNAGSNSARDEAGTRADGEERLAFVTSSSAAVTPVVRDADSGVGPEATPTEASVAASSKPEPGIKPTRVSTPPEFVASQEIVPATVEAKPRVVEASPVGEIRRFEGHGGPVNSVAVSRDARRVLSGSADETIRLWDVDTGRELQKIQAHSKGVDCVAMSGDGRLGLSVGNDRTLKLWDLERGEKLRDFAYDGEGEDVVALSPDASMALSAGWEGRVRLWDVRTGKPIRVFEGHTNAVNDVTFTPDGRRALSSSDDLTARLWDVGTGRELCRFEGHTGYVHCVAMTPYGLHVLTGSGGRMSGRNMVTNRDTGARLWDPTTGKQVRKLIASRIFVNCLAISPDGRRVLSTHGGALVASEGGTIAGAFGGSDGQVHLWDLESGKELKAFDGHGEAVLCVAFLGDGRRAISASVDSTIRLWGLPE